jgi:hypothetical protein
MPRISTALMGQLCAQAFVSKWNHSLIVGCTEGRAHACARPSMRRLGGAGFTAVTDEGA